MPSYLKTFNYILLNNLLSLESKFKPNIIDLKPNCHLCLTHNETDNHLFSKCAKINPLLHHTTRLFFNVTGKHTTYFFDMARIQFHTPLPPTPYCNNLTPYLNTVLSYTIWKTRNQNKFQPSPINPHTRDDHGSGLDWTGSGLKPILAGSGLDRTAFFFKLGVQDWIGLRKFLLF